MTLMPVSNMSGTRLELVERRRVAVDLPPVLDGADVVGVEGLAEHVEDVAERGVSHRDRQTPTQVPHGRAPVQAVGGLEADAADPALADLLGHLGGDGDLRCPRARGPSRRPC